MATKIERLDDLAQVVNYFGSSKQHYHN
jgi:hypothetical protein